MVVSVMAIVNMVLMVVAFITVLLIVRVVLMLVTVFLLIVQTALTVLWKLGRRYFPGIGNNVGLKLRWLKINVSWKPKRN